MIEALQGPCKNNQKCLAENKIVEFVQKFLFVFQNQNDYRNKGFFSADEQNGDDGINQLMIMSIELLGNLLEANDDPEIFKALSNKLDIRILRVKLL